MSADEIPCITGPSVAGEVRTWSEDPLTARTRATWTGATGATGATGDHND